MAATRRSTRVVQSRSRVGPFGIQHLLAFERGQYTFLALLLLALLAGLAAHEFGFHPAVGAYMAGLILRDEYFHTGETEGSYGQIKRTIDVIAFSAIGPVSSLTWARS